MFAEIFLNFFARELRRNSLKDGTFMKLPKKRYPKFYFLKSCLFFKSHQNNWCKSGNLTFLSITVCENLIFSRRIKVKSSETIPLNYLYPKKLAVMDIQSYRPKVIEVN